MKKQLVTAMLILLSISLPARAQDSYQQDDPQDFPSYYPQDDSQDRYEQQDRYQQQDRVQQGETFNQEEILTKVESFFGQGAESIGKVVQKIFKDQGEPNAYIEGEEVAAAVGVGLRYGRGTFIPKGGYGRPIFWQGPSIGFDVGVNVSKVFVLIYHLPDESALFQRFPGVEGSLYYVGGVGVNYLQSGNIVVAPIRLGAGWRQGLSAGYMDFTERAHFNPF